MKAKPIVYNGKEWSSYSALAKRLKVSERTVRRRIVDQGLPPRKKRFKVEVAELARLHGLSRGTVVNRLAAGDDIERSLRVPQKQRENGEWRVLVEKAKLVGITEKGLRQRLADGMRVEAAVSAPRKRRKNVEAGAMVDGRSPRKAGG